MAKSYSPSDTGRNVAMVLVRDLLVCGEANRVRLFHRQEVMDKPARSRKGRDDNEIRGVVGRTLAV